MSKKSDRSENTPFRNDDSFYNSSGGDGATTHVQHPRFKEKLANNSTNPSAEVQWPKADDALITKNTSDEQVQELWDIRGQLEKLYVDMARRAYFKDEWKIREDFGIPPLMKEREIHLMERLARWYHEVGAAESDYTQRLEANSEAVKDAVMKLKKQNGLDMVPYSGHGKN